MAVTQKDFWEHLWEKDKDTDFSTYLALYVQKSDKIAELFRERGVQTVCDAACGFGAYSLMLLSHGFRVEGFDIAPQAVATAQKLLGAYGYDASAFWTSDVLNISCHKEYDAVTARSVLDHLHVDEAKKGVEELLRITRKGGLLAMSFDGPEEETLPHSVEPDGSILYTEGRKKGMVFHTYTDAELKDFFQAYTVVLTYTNEDGERFVVIQK